MKVLGPVRPDGLERERNVRIWLPRGYDANHAHRVLVMFDGQNVFDDDRSFAGGWHLHRAVDALATAKRRPPVVVGIDHGHEHRIHELSPFPVQGGDGKLDAFLEWIANGVLPLVAQHANIARGAVNTAIGGSSMGGLAALYAHFRRPDLFGGAIAMSPSLWVGRGAIFDFVAKQSTPMISRVYLDCGGREGRMIQLAERMASHLRERGYRGEQLMWRPDPKGTHSEQHWRRRAPKALRFMYREAG
jgi:predicted alpha/beta superfamily hydrolase